MKIVILKDGAGNPQGVIREVAGGNERLYDSSGASIATYRRNVDFTYDNNGACFGSGNRLAGLPGLGRLVKAHRKARVGRNPFQWGDNSD